MASSDNLAFLFRPTLTDSLISEAYARDTQTLTKAFQQSLSNNIFSTSSFSISQTLSSDSFFNLVSSSQTPPSATPSASNISGSDTETPAPKRQRNGIGIPSATSKVSKRKSRSSKRSQTTFITADPANFRQMVQHVTGVRFSNAQLSAVPVLKPEPQRPGNRSLEAGGCLPTLDTSAFLLDHHHQQLQQMDLVSGPINGSETVAFPESVVNGPGLDFDAYCSFPTLESWN